MRVNVVWLGILLLLAGSTAQAVPTAGTLWIGNDTVGDVFATDAVGNVTQSVPGTPVTGIAFDGSSLFFGSRPGNITERTADGQTVINSFSVPSLTIGEDLAWDSKRNRLWRIDHGNRLDRIDPVAGTLDMSFTLSTVHPNFNRLGGLGVAYDSNRDLLYVSYCDFGCSSLVKGLVQTFDPATSTLVGDLFFVNGFATGGLAYDPIGDTLWVGDSQRVRNMDLTGGVLSSFARPQPGGFVDGLAFIPAAVPEPGTLGLLFLGAALFRRARSRS